MNHFNNKGHSPTFARKRTKVTTGRPTVSRPHSKRCATFFLFILISIFPSLVFPQANISTDKGDNISGEYVQSSGNYWTHGETVRMVNPVASGTLLEFTSKTDALAVVEVYDVQGAKVASLFHDNVKANETHAVTFLGEGLPDGIYIYVLTTGNRSYYQKLILER